MSDGKLPENFLRLHAGEETIRAKSIKTIEASEELMAHALLLEVGMDTIDHFVRSYQTEDRSERIIQHLGARTFNGSSSAFKLLLSGYYQASALLQRDLLETAFLLHYFVTDKSLIQEWSDLPAGERRKKFGPVQVRSALDKLQGFTERKREKAYRLYSELAGHPTPEGFAMIKPQGQDAHAGPFFDETALKAVLSEFARTLVQTAAHFSHLFAAHTVNGLATRIRFMEAQAQWFERFYERTFDRKPIEELKAMLLQATRNP